MDVPIRSLTLLTFLSLALGTGPTNAVGAETQTLDVLLIGNSYTARHKLAFVVKAMAEAGDPGLSFHPTTVIYGGRRLADHWRLGTQNIVRVSSLTPSQTFVSSTTRIGQGTATGIPSRGNSPRKIALIFSESRGRATRNSGN